MSNINDLTVAQLKRAIEIREEIESLQEQLKAIGGGCAIASAPAASNGKRSIRRLKTGRRMSAAGRARIAAAAKARWAKFRGDTKSTSNSASSESVKAAKPAKTKRFNAAARAKLSAAAKARWAKAKAAGKSVL